MQGDSPDTLNPISQQPELKYPLLNINGHQPDQDMPPSSVNNDTDSGSDVTHDSLADSSYEIISESATLDDDEGSYQDGADSLASLSESSPEDAMSDDELVRVPNGDSSQDGPATATPQEPTPEEHLSESLLESSIADSRLTAETVRQSPMGSIRFDEPIKQPSRKPAEVIYPLDGNIGSSIHGFGKYGLQPGKGERFSARQTLAGGKLHLNKPFRIAYHGNPQFRDVVIEKIAQSLTVSTFNTPEDELSNDVGSKYSIVQLSSFGADEGAPQITLVPSNGPELIVNSCEMCCKWQSYPSFGSREPSSEYFISEHLAHEAYSDGQKPDLAVFFHHLPDENATGLNDHPRKTKVDSFDVSESTKNMGIPTLDISNTVSAWATGLFKPYNNKAVHMCIEDTDRSLKRDAAVICRMPINLERFIEIDAYQLNRNIACITESASVSRGLLDNVGMPPFNIDGIEHGVRIVHDKALDLWELVKARGWTQWILLLLPLILTLLLTLGTNLTSTSKSIDSPTFFTLDGKSFTPKLVAQPNTGAQLSKAFDSSEIMSLFYPELNSAHLNPPKTTDGNGGAMRPTEIAFHVKPLYGYASPWGSGFQPLNPRLQLSRSRFGTWQVHMPNEIARLGRPLEIAVFVSNSDRHWSWTAAFNSTTYALDIQADGKFDTAHVKVGTGKHPYIQQNFTHVVPKSWATYATIESGLKSRLAHTKDISLRMGTELASVGARAQVAALSSTGKLEQSLRSLQRSYSTALQDAWVHAHNRHAALSKSIQKKQHALSLRAERRIIAASASAAKHISQRAGSLKKVQAEMGRRLNQAAKEASSNVGQACQSFARIDGRHYLPSLDTSPLRKARRRAVSLLNQLEKLPSKAASFERQKSRSWETCYVRKGARSRGCRRGSRG